jgi:hypothetical protein
MKKKHHHEEYRLFFLEERRKIDAASVLLLMCHGHGHPHHGMIHVSNLAFVDPLLLYESVSNTGHNYSITTKFG